MKKIKTGVKGLDKLLKGGLPEGRNILVSGSCGTGKTTLAMQFVYEGIKQFKEPGVFVTLEEDKEKLYSNMKNFGWDLKTLETQGKLLVLGGQLSTLNSYKKKYKAKAEDLIGEISDVVRETGAERIAIDSLNLFTLLFRGPLEKREAVADLCASLSKLNCTSFLTSEIEEGSIALSSNGIEEYVVDGVIVLYMLKQASDFVQGIAVRKMRGIEHERAIKNYSITSKGIEVYPTEPMFAEWSDKK